jgi:hypothetical protein
MPIYGWVLIAVAAAVLLAVVVAGGLMRRRTCIRETRAPAGHRTSEAGAPPFAKPATPRSSQRLGAQLRSVLAVAGAARTVVAT